MNAMFKRVTALCIVTVLMVSLASADSGADTKSKQKKTTAASVPPVTAEDIKALRDAIASQQQQIQELRNELQRRDEASRQAAEAARQAQSTASDAASKASAAETAASASNSSLDKIKSDLADVKLNQQNAAISTQDDQKKVGALEGTVGRFRLSGDIRVRGESFLQNYSGCTACIDRHRSRIRLRLGIDSKLGEDFTGGIYLATGAFVNGAPSFTDPISTNETLTGFFERKTIGIDRGWITYQPQAHKWLQLTGGKFAYTFQRTNWTLDPDLNPEGFSEKLSFDVKNKVVKNLTFQGL